MLSNSPSRSPGKGDAILIAAQSGRALAAAARRAGLRPFVVDLFGDTDTRALASGYRKAKGRFGLDVSGPSLLTLLDELAREAGSPQGIVLGSGFEANPDLIATIQLHYRLFGSSAETVRTVKDPVQLSSLTSRLGIPHPPVRFEPTADPEAWLVKRAGGSGGGHVRPAARARLGAGLYLQRRVRGTPYSFAFLADGQDAVLVSTTQQWVAPCRRAPFRYGGAVEPGNVPQRVRDSVVQALRSLAAATGLRGLMSADCLLDGEEWWVLEINPRPGATLDILDRRTIPLLQAHIDSCLGHVPFLDSPVGAAASQVLYAPRTIAVVPDLDWPDYIMDQPQPGSRVAAGAPLCTVFAEGCGTSHVLDLLRVRSGEVRAVCFSEGLNRAAPFRPSER